MFSVKGGGIAFVDRGDIAAYDFVSANFTKDTQWHDLDLSAIVGAKAVWVLIHVAMTHSTTNEEIRLKTKGNSNDYNMAHRKNKEANYAYYHGLWVQTDAAGKIEYKITAGTYSVLNFTIRGWFA